MKCSANVTLVQWDNSLLSFYCRHTQEKWFIQTCDWLWTLSKLIERRTYSLPTIEDIITPILGLKKDHWQMYHHSKEKSNVYYAKMGMIREHTIWICLVHLESAQTYQMLWRYLSNPFPCLMDNTPEKDADNSCVGWSYCWLSIIFSRMICPLIVYITDDRILLSKG